MIGYSWEYCDRNGIPGYDDWKLRSPDDDRDEECYHDNYDIDLAGRAHCQSCGEVWWPSDGEIAAYREQNEMFDQHMQAEERRQWWSDRWQQLLTPWHWLLRRTVNQRLWLEAWLRRRGWKRVNLISVDDEIPF